AARDRAVFGAAALRAPAAAGHAQLHGDIEGGAIDTRLATRNDLGKLVHDLGRKALTTASCVVKNGPSSRSIQYGIAGNTASRQSRIALGLPGRLTISERPRIPPTCRLRIAVGTTCSDTERISSPKPGKILSHTTSVASGVTSRSAGPV